MLTNLQFNKSVGNDPATGEFALIVNVEAQVIVDSTIKNAEVVCQNVLRRRKKTLFYANEIDVKAKASWKLKRFTS